MLEFLVKVNITKITRIDSKKQNKIRSYRFTRKTLDGKKPRVEKRKLTMSKNWYKMKNI